MDNDKIYLISDQPACSGGYAQGTLRMGNMGGYVDGVRVIDEICNACFKNNSYLGIIARNLKIEDIEEMTKYEYMNDIGWGRGPVQSSYCKYPSVWETYEKNNLFKTRSISYGIIDWTTKVGSASITSNSWSHSFTENEATNEWINPIYYELVISNSIRSSYPKDVWLSSRSIMPCSQGVGWRNVQNITEQWKYFSCAILLFRSIS